MIAQTYSFDISAIIRPAIIALILATAGLPFASAQAQERAYGYYEVVNAESLNIRSRPYLNSEVVTVAPRGATLIKWKRFCSLRAWCPVQYGEVRGWAGKAFLAEIDGD